ncbi:putative HNHc nuclease [Turicibacter sanguinis]|uniref:putative HNHc nuclease n=1 Tax=Turicibacter sanguinis TaxID=154288 RepID=UPI0029427CAC|nr:putative HNHc nuclease [Turicibacter sanguinis]
MHKAIFFDYHETEKGAWFKVHVPGWFPNKKIIQKWMNGIVKIDDGRTISAKQRKLIYALFKDISLYTGYEVEELKELLKIDFMIDKDRDYFSLSNVEMEIATEFIEYILEFMFAWDIPINKRVVVLAREVNNFLYLCLIHRKCAVCGSHADIHHHENLVGMGMDRAKHNHIDSRFIALCRVHHNECHNIGHKTFEDKYKITAIKLNSEVIDKLGV